MRIEGYIESKLKKDRERTLERNEGEKKGLQVNEGGIIMKKEGMTNGRK